MSEVRYYLHILPKAVGSHERSSTWTTKSWAPTMPVLEMDLQPGESIISEAGELSWMTSSIQLQTSTQMGGGGGVFRAFKRAAGGGTLFMTEYRADGGPGSVAFATKVPGNILNFDISGGQRTWSTGTASCALLQEQN